MVLKNVTYFLLVMSLSCHILDTTNGLPAREVECVLKDNLGNVLGTGRTNNDGRIRWEGITLSIGVYELLFQTAEYFTDAGRSTFFPHVSIAFQVTDSSHYHIPLLLSNYGYSTYRGS